MAKGIRDNWSQVRYAASVAARSFVQKAGEAQERFFPQLLGPMCLNRHYVAEGVRLYSQETWRIVCGPQGGARLLVAHFDRVIDAYVEAAEAPNHAVREAACHCISELANRVAGTPEAPTPFREHFTSARVDRLMQTLLSAFQDESWPVRDVSSTAIGFFVSAFPFDCVTFRDQLMELWFEQMADNIPSLRANGAAAVAMAVKAWPQLWREVLPRLGPRLREVQMQIEQSEVFSDYTPSGPFSVPKPKPSSLEDTPDPQFVNQTMFSCGSVAPKTFKRKQRVKDSGCMNCNNETARQPWESSEGMVYLMGELASLAARTQTKDSEEHLAAIAANLPELNTAFACSQYRHHHLLKQRVCERLPALTEALGMVRMQPHFPPLLRTVAECAEQEMHRGLQAAAMATLSAWGARLSAAEAEVACAAAAVDVRVLTEA